MIARLKRMPFAWWISIPFVLLLIVSLAGKAGHALGWTAAPPNWLAPDGAYLPLVIVLALIAGEQVRAARGMPPQPVFGLPLRHFVVAFIAIAALMLIMDAATAATSPTAPG
jgi:hypothetical protein